jgi:hypothetical protein
MLRIVAGKCSLHLGSKGPDCHSSIHLSACLSRPRRSLDKVSDRLLIARPAVAARLLTIRLASAGTWEG